MKQAVVVVLVSTVHELKSQHAKIKVGGVWVASVTHPIVGMPEFSRFRDCREREWQGAVDSLLHLELGSRGFGDGHYGFHGRGATYHSTAWGATELAVQ